MTGPDALKSYWNEFYTSFRKTGGWVFGLLGVVLGAWAIWFPTPFMADGRWLLGLGVVGYMLIASLADLSLRAHSNAQSTPKVETAMKIEDVPYVLISPGKLFGNDTAVIVYQVDQGFEIEVGVGRALQISGDRVQVAIVDTRGKTELWDRICAKEAGILATLLVRSALPFGAYQRLEAQ